MKKKILYLECKTGAAGDMLMSALYALLSEEQKTVFLKKINSLDSHVCVVPEDKTVRGIGGIHMKVEIGGKEETEHMKEHNNQQEHSHVHREHGEQGHHHMHQKHGQEHHAHTGSEALMKKIRELDLPEKIRQHALEIYRMIAEAECKVHRSDMKNIHFHEVGSVDALIDVTGCCIAIDMLGADIIEASPVCVGNGTVRCAHGILPVPAPATAEIIKGMPVYSSSFDGELLTPTGAAILKYFVQDYKKEMQIEIAEIGYGFGTKEFEQLSCVRAFLGERIA